MTSILKTVQYLETNSLTLSSRMLYLVAPSRLEIKSFVLLLIGFVVEGEREEEEELELLLDIENILNVFNEIFLIYSVNIYKIR